jgi:hypothetical protein
MTDPNTNSTQTIATSVLDTLVGPGKKYADAETLAKSRLDADNYIETLKTENKELRGLVTEQDTRLHKLESKVSILDRLNVNTSGTVDNDGSQNGNQPEPKVVGLSEDDVIKVVENRERDALALANKREVDNTLNKLFGAEAAGFLLQKAADLGVDPSELKSLALKSPKMFYNTLGINPNAKPGSTTYVGNQSSTSQSTTEPVRNHAYYEGLKKKMGVKAFFLDRGLQAQRMRDLSQLGEAWDAT